MEIIKLTEQNIANEHICCAISDKKCTEGYKAKKDWLKNQFKDCAKRAECDNTDGLTVYYSNACPFTEYYVNTELAKVAKKKGVNLLIKKLETKEQAQNHFVPHTIYSIFYNGKFVTQHILNEKYFDKFVPIN